MKISVIIPTFRRLKTLFSCLKCLSKQTLAQKFFEVIIIFDEIFDEKKIKIPKLPITTYYLFNQVHGGPAVARNLGIKKATGEILLFLGDDIFASPNLLKIHFQFHQKNPQKNWAVLGKVDWHPKLKIDNFMEWLLISGLQADYFSLKSQKPISFKYFYANNLSLKRQFLLANGLFDEDFKHPLFEDTELGYRLAKKGLKLFYEKRALAYHWHKIKLKSYLKKMELRGKTGHLLYQKHPELKDKIFPTKLPLKEILRLKFWQLLYPFGKLFNQKTILFQNYQRLIITSLLKGYHAKKQ